MTQNKQIAAGLSSFTTLLDKATSRSSTITQIYMDADDAIQQPNPDVTPFHELASIYEKRRQAKVVAVKKIRALFEDELFNFKREVGRAVVIMAQNLLNKPAVNQNIATTRFGELIKMSGLAYYNDDGTCWTKPRIYAQSFYHQISSWIDSDEQDTDDNTDFGWITLDKDNPNLTKSWLVQACQVWKKDPDSEEFQAFVIAEYLRSLIDDTDYKRPLKEMNMGAENSTLDIPVGTSLRAAISSILYPEYADEIIQQFEIVCKRR